VKSYAALVASVFRANQRRIEGVLAGNPFLVEGVTRDSIQFTSRAAAVAALESLFATNRGVTEAARRLALVLTGPSHILFQPGVGGMEEVQG